MLNGNGTIKKTLLVRVPNFISSLSNDGTIYTNPFMINNLGWKIMLTKRASSLEIFLECDPGCTKNPNWSCYAKATITFVSEDFANTYRQTSFSRSMEHVFHSRKVGWGFPDVMSWDTVTNPRNNYIKNDCIRFKIELTVDPPIEIEEVNKVSNDTSPTEIVAKFESLNAELSRLKQDLVNEKSKSEKLSKELNANRVTKIYHDASLAKIESLKTELSRLTQDLVNEKSKSEKLSKELNANRVAKMAEMELLKSEVSQLKQDLVNEKSKSDKLSKELNANRLTIRSLESKIGNSVVMNKSGKNEFEIVPMMGSLTEAVAKLESMVATLEIGRKSDEVCVDNECCPRITALEAELRKLKSDLAIVKCNSEKLSTESTDMKEFLTEWTEKQQMLLKYVLEGIGSSSY